MQEEDGGGDPKDAGIPKGDEAKEEAKKQEEKAAMEALQKEYGSESLRNSFWRLVKFDDPDTIMLRFMRARKWDTTRAVAMLAGCIKWRLDNGVDDLAEQGDLINGEKVEKFLEQQRSGKTYALGTALNEQPICYIHVARHFTFSQPGTSMQKYVIYAMESFRLLIMPPNDKATILFDMTGFGIRNMDWNCILFIVKCLEAYFPESLGIMLIHNAPWIFNQIWKVLAPLLDPVVRSKIRFTKGPSDMEDRIPAERFLDSLKGTMTTKFEFIEPEKDDNKLHEDKEKREQTMKNYMDLAKEYEDATRAWASKGDSKASDKRQVLVKKLRIAQFEMEPYWRGKTVVHRAGQIDGQGIVTWVYEQKDGETIRHVVGRRHCVAVMRREIKEIEEGSSIQDAEKKSEEAEQNSDWVKLYGDEETARFIEGPRVDGKVPPIGWLSEQTKKHGGVIDSIKQKSPSDDSAEKTNGNAAAAAGGAGAGGAAAAGSGNKEELPAKDTFEDAPQAPQEQTSKAVDGDAKVDEKADTAEAGGAAPDASEINGKKESQSNEKSDGKPAPIAKVQDKGQTIGKKFKGVFGKMMA